MHGLDLVLRRASMIIKLPLLACLPWPFEHCPSKPCLYPIPPRQAPSSPFYAWAGAGLVASTGLLPSLKFGHTNAQRISHPHTRRLACLPLTRPPSHNHTTQSALSLGHALTFSRRQQQRRRRKEPTCGGHGNNSNSSSRSSSSSSSSSSGVRPSLPPAPLSWSSSSSVHSSQ